MDPGNALDPDGVACLQFHTFCTQSYGKRLHFARLVVASRFKSRDAGIFFFFAHSGALEKFSEKHSLNSSEFLSRNQSSRRFGAEQGNANIEDRVAEKIVLLVSEIYDMLNQKYLTTKNN